jgi:LCP family protein required for cell wall assembly
MKTTLKRGIGRATAANGNGHAIFPPAILSSVRRYRQPFRRRRTESVLLALTGTALGAALGVGLAAAAFKTFEHGWKHVHLGMPAKGAAGAAVVVVSVMLVAWLLAYRATRRDRRAPFWERIGIVTAWVCAVALAVNAGAAGGAYLYFHQAVVVAVSPHSKDVRDTEKHLNIPRANEPAIALVLGYDRRYGEADRGRSDTMMLVRADPITNSISLLSLPRDLTTNIWCGKQIVASDQRINDAYSMCGSLGALDTVRHLTGLPINYLITVNFAGFIKIVDEVGGVWIDVDRRYYNKNVGTYDTNYANIDLKPGYQLVKGRDALAYVRYRHTDSDLFRIARQQQFVKSFKQQLHANFGVTRMLKIIRAFTHNVEIGSPAGAGSLENAIIRYGLFAYGLPAGNFFQAKIGDLTGYNTLSAPQSAINAAVHDFVTPDVQAPQNATAVEFGRKAAGVKAPPPSRTPISVLNGNGYAGSASNAAYELGQRGYRIVVPPSKADRNAPTYTYWHTEVLYDKRQPGSAAAAKKVANLFGDATAKPLPRNLRAKAYHAMLTVVVGRTFHGTLAPAPADKTPQKQKPYVRYDPGQSESLLKSERKHAAFPLMVPTVVEQSSYIDSEMPIRVYPLSPRQRALRLTFKTDQLAGYWGIEETPWMDAPALQQPNFKHTIGGRRFSFYYSGAHLHMVVLTTPDASYWVVNTLDDELSNETMIEIAKNLKPLR